MWLWLDDVRPMPDDFDCRAWTAQEAIQFLETDEVTLISFDHDLGDPEDGTGYDVARWIEAAANEGSLLRVGWAVHSDNPVGRRNITLAMRQAEIYWAHNEA